MINFKILLSCLQITVVFNLRLSFLACHLSNVKQYAKGQNSLNTVTFKRKFCECDKHSSKALDVIIIRQVSYRFFLSVRNEILSSIMSPNILTHGAESCLRSQPVFR